MPSSLEERAREIAAESKVGIHKARSIAALEAYGIDDPRQPVNYEDIKKAVISGEAYMFGRLIEIAADNRCKPETAILATNVYLSQSRERAQNGAVTGLIDPDPDV